MPREKGIDEIEVHVATLCFETLDGVQRVLIGKRAPNRKIYPDLWECGGGQVRKGQTFQDAVRAQMHDEFGLDVDVLFSLNDYKIETEGKVIPGIRFVCRPKSSQRAKICSSEHVEFKWVTVEEMRTYDLIPGLLQDVRMALDWQKKLVKAA